MLLKQTEPTMAAPWPRPAVTHTAKMTQTGDSGPYTVHTLNHDPGLNTVYAKYSVTKYWAENKPDSILDTGYSSKLDYNSLLWLIVKYISVQEKDVKMDSDKSDSDLNVVLDVSATNEYCNNEKMYW